MNTFDLPAYTLGAHQIDALERLGNGKVLRGAVGTGKSRTAIGYFASRVCNVKFGEGYDLSNEDPPRSVDLYVITTAKKRDSLDWESEAAQFGISTDRESSLGKIKLSVDSWNNLNAYINVEGAFFIFDEQRLVGSGSWVKAFQKIAKNNQWILLSGTPGDSWIEYAPLFIANGFYRNRKDFIDQHVVYSRYSRYPKIDRYVGTGVLGKHRHNLLVEMPFAMHTKRHEVYLDVDFDKALVEEVIKTRWNFLTQSPLRDASDLFRMLRMIVNSDSSRVKALLSLLERHPCLIIFYNFNYELDILKSSFSQHDIAVAEWNGHKHQPVPQSGRWVYLVQYTAGAEGWNCVSTNAMAFFSLNYSYKIMEQAMGRIDRMNTKFIDLWYYILFSNSIPDNAVRRAFKSKKNFNKSGEIKALKQAGWVDPTDEEKKGSISY